jgi:hypothetical protein
MTLDQQDELARKIIELWPEAQLIDRRVNDSHGYRAVHLVPKIGRCSVEIQLRTMWQDTWAQLMESYGDAWGRAIRYGGDPDEPGVIVTESDPPMTRRQAVDRWKTMGNMLHELAKAENAVARMRAATPEGGDALDRLDSSMESLKVQFRDLRTTVESVREELDQQSRG